MARALELGGTGAGMNGYQEETDAFVVLWITLDDGAGRVIDISETGFSWLSIAKNWSSLWDGVEIHADLITRADGRVERWTWTRPLN